MPFARGARLGSAPSARCRKADTGWLRGEHQPCCLHKYSLVVPHWCPILCRDKRLCDIVSRRHRLINVAEAPGSYSQPLFTLATPRWVLFDGLQHTLAHAASPFASLSFRSRYAAPPSSSIAALVSAGGLSSLGCNPSAHSVTPIQPAGWRAWCGLRSR